MRRNYNGNIERYPRITLSEERKLLSKAQKGSIKSRDEIVLRHIGFLMFRIHKRVFPALIRRFGEDLLEETILILYKKIKSYDLDYRDKQGKPHPVKFISYIWKRIDGFIIDYLKKEMCFGKKIVNFDDNIAASNVMMNHYHSSSYTVLDT